LPKPTPAYVAARHICSFAAVSSVCTAVRKLSASIYRTKHTDEAHACTVRSFHSPPTLQSCVSSVPLDCAYPLRRPRGGEQGAIGCLVLFCFVLFCLAAFLRRSSLASFRTLRSDQVRRDCFIPAANWVATALYLLLNESRLCLSGLCEPPRCETPLFAPFLYKMHHFTRLGTNIGKALKTESVAFRIGDTLHLVAASWSCGALDVRKRRFLLFFSFSFSCLCRCLWLCLCLFFSLTFLLDNRYRNQGFAKTGSGET
jgi:hypothetical protein